MLPVTGYMNIPAHVMGLHTRVCVVPVQTDRGEHLLSEPRAKQANLWFYIFLLPLGFPKVAKIP